MSQYLRISLIFIFSPKRQVSLKKSKKLSDFYTYYKFCYSSTEQIMLKTTYFLTSFTNFCSISQSISQQLLDPGKCQLESIFSTKCEYVKWFFTKE